MGCRSGQSVIGIEARTIQLEQSRAMEIVGAILRDDLNLRAAEAAQFGVIGVRDDFDLFDRVRVRRDHGGRAPGHAGRLARRRW